MDMIMHNGIHYVPATELAKANDKISGIETDLMLTKVALKQRIDQINVADSVIDDRNDRIDIMQERIRILDDNADDYRKANSFYAEDNAKLSSRILELETAAQQLICDIKNKRGVIVDTEA